MTSTVIKRSVVINGRKTSVSLEDAFWCRLKDIARVQHMTLSKILADIDEQRNQGNLSSSIRLFVLNRVCLQVSSIPEDRVAVDMMNREAHEITNSESYGR